MRHDQRGRPPNPEGTQLEVTLRVCFTDQQAALLRDSAKDTPISQFIRQRVLESLYATSTSELCSRSK